MQKYIHYCASVYDPARFKPIQNEFFIKPQGGLWASPINTGLGWKDWCERESFRECVKENSFTFILAETARVLHIRKSNDLDSLPRNKQVESLGSGGVDNYLDFEAIQKSGVDAIQLHLSDEEHSEKWNWKEGLYWQLYGWDCDSILIMNPAIIVLVDEAA